MRTVTKVMLVFAAAVMSAGSVASDATSTTKVDVKWDDPKSYTDMRPSNESRNRFEKRIMRDFDNYFKELAASLPNGQKLNITVTNVDLAGMVWPTFGMGAIDMRIIREVDIPRISFSYSLVQRDEVIKSDEVSLKDMNFLRRGSVFRNTDTLRHEKAMIKRWFTQEFTDIDAKS